MKNKLFIISMVIWIVATLFRMLNHIPWLDEAHAWTIAQDLSIVEIVKLMKIEGHTLIWYLMLMPFAKLGFPYITESLISWIIMCITTWLILTKSPFKKFA